MDIASVHNFFSGYGPAWGAQMCLTNAKFHNAQQRWMEMLNLFCGGA